MVNGIIRRSIVSACTVSLLAVAPLAAQVTVEGNTVREHQAQPGDTYSASFVVTNASDEPQQAKLYQTDYFTSADGTNLYGAPGTSSRSNARWVSVPSLALLIPPRSSREVTVTVAVPATLPLTGTYWSMVMVEGVPHGSGESTLPTVARQKVQAAVVARIRYAVQIVTHVGADARREARFEAPTVRATADGTKLLQVDVVNTGVRSFVPALALELFAQDGTRVKTASAAREITYPGTSLRQQFNLGPLPSGTYRALVTLDAGADAVFGAQYTLKL
jgi:urease gamma subunit